MGATHTPGPWNVEDGIFPGEDYDVHSDIQVIAEGIENAADARLIAAGPEMLAALVAICGGMGLESGGNIRVIPIETLKLGQTAIRLAETGERA